ncbi:uncharacterized protein V2V93DRAFT_371430 [Kockiozyma suomiensis]|uniref:uncharacterized protein n=1 Tax=Kockiozyma suomiensis TaxID=1337062 RepID=UPI0033433EF2
MTSNISSSQHLPCRASGHWADSDVGERTKWVADRFSLCPLTTADDTNSTSCSTYKSAILTDHCESGRKLDKKTEQNPERMSRQETSSRKEKAGNEKKDVKELSYLSKELRQILNLEPSSLPPDFTSFNPHKHKHKHKHRYQTVHQHTADRNHKLTKPSIKRELEQEDEAVIQNDEDDEDEKLIKELAHICDLHDLYPGQTSNRESLTKKESRLDRIINERSSATIPAQKPHKSIRSRAREVTSHFLR